MWEEMKSFIVYAVAAIFSIFVAYADGQSQCGRPDWKNVEYDYHPDHNGSESKAAAVVQVSEDKGNLSLVAYRSAQKQSFFYSPEYFKTQNNGKSWHPLIGEQPQHSPTVPFLYFQSPSESRILYRLVDDMGLYLRSEDSGRTWILPQYEIESMQPSEFAQQITGGRGYHLEIRIVGVHPHEPKTLYAAVWVSPWPNSAEELKDHRLEGVYRSIDGGDHWKKFTEEVRAFGLNWTQSLALGVSPVNPSIFLGVGRHGIEKSEDGAKTWQPVGQVALFNQRPIYRAEKMENRKMLGAPVGIEVYGFLFDPLAERIVYMLTNRGLFKTTNLGESWFLLDLGFDEIDAITTMSMNPTRSDQIVVGSRYGLYLSDDGGCHFQRIPSPGERVQKQERAGGN